MVFAPLNQPAKLQPSLLAPRPPSSCEEAMGRRCEPQPARLRSIRLDRAKTKVETTPTATRQPTIAALINLS
jgi:hypothetical protein